ncbi:MULTISPECIES: hypothetical protein [Synechococcales]|uniref:hypothetical protein n=1 Tax=Synechococcus sp. CS-1326 TaxID=2847978 RepID=UPI00223C099F|nr:hypothetical protein [Synechococcus sp. CS-1326]
MLPIQAATEESNGPALISDAATNISVQGKTIDSLKEVLIIAQKVTARSTANPTGENPLDLDGQESSS